MSGWTAEAWSDRVVKEYIKINPNLDMRLVLTLQPMFVKLVNLIAEQTNISVHEFINDLEHRILALCKEKRSGKWSSPDDYEKYVNEWVKPIARGCTSRDEGLDERMYQTLGSFSVMRVTIMTVEDTNVMKRAVEWLTGVVDVDDKG